MANCFHSPPQIHVKNSSSASWPELRRKKKCQLLTNSISVLSCFPNSLSIDEVRKKERKIYTKWEKRERMVGVTGWYLDIIKNAKCIIREIVKVLGVCWDAFIFVHSSLNTP